MELIMKKINRLLLAGLLVTSCTDIVCYEEGYVPACEIENTGEPVITAVYDVADTAMTTPLTEGEMGQMLHLVGHNLNHLKALSFNTVEADLKETYTFADGANVVIPNKLSLAHDNTISYTTDKGTCSFPFVIPFPDLTVGGAECEFVTAGSTMKIVGKNFDLYDFGESSSVSIASQPLDIVGVSSAALEVTIPEGTPDNSSVLLEWENQMGESLSTTIPFRPTRNLLYGDMTDVSMNVDGPVSVSKDEGYLHITGTFGAWSWNTIDLSRNMIDVGTMDDLSEWLVKFEVKTADSYPLTEVSPLQWSFNWSKEYRWEMGTLNTHGQWRTVALPLAEMAGKGIPSAGTWLTLRLIFQPTAEYDADFCIANIRLVRK